MENGILNGRKIIFVLFITNTGKHFQNYLLYYATGT